MAGRICLFQDRKCVVVELSFSIKIYEQIALSRKHSLPKGWDPFFSHSCVWTACSFSEIEVGKLREGELIYPARAICGAVNSLVMHQNKNAIGCSSDINFDHLDAKIDTLFNGCYRVLWRGFPTSTVGDNNDTLRVGRSQHALKVGDSIRY